jgi:hypothetical protein
VDPFYRIFDKTVWCGLWAARLCWVVYLGPVGGHACFR